MSYRYAVLWELALSAQPVGVVVDRQTDVLVALPASYGLPETYSRPYRVLQPDLTEVVYKPGDAAYFDHVLIDLQRHFAIKGDGVVSSCDDTIVCGLIQDNVLSPRTRRRKTEYAIGIKDESADLYVHACVSQRSHIGVTASLLPVEADPDTRVAQHRVPQVA